MAYDTLVDGAKLEENLTKVADTIRGVTDYDDIMEFPDDMVEILGKLKRTVYFSKGATASLADKLSGKACRITWLFTEIDENGEIYIPTIVDEDTTYAFVITESGMILTGTIADSTLETIEKSDGDPGWTVGVTSFGSYKRWTIDPNFLVLDMYEVVLVLAVTVET